MARRKRNTNWSNVGDFAQGKSIQHIDTNSVDPELSDLSGYWRPGEVNSKHYKNFYFDPMLSCGDYNSNGLVGKSNFEVFIEEFGDRAGVYEVAEDYNSYAVAIDVDVTDQDILETLSALADYALLDENHHSELEAEAQSEGWDAWARDDFVTALEKRFDLDLDDINEDKLFEVFQNASDTMGICWEDSSEGMLIDAEGVAEGVTRNEILDLGTSHSE